MRKVYVRIQQILLGTAICAACLILGVGSSASIAVMAWGTPLVFLALLPLAIAAHCFVMKALPHFAEKYTSAPGTARMGKYRDLRRNGLLIERREDFYCGQMKGRSVYYSGARHMVTLGPSRAGKDTGLVTPNIRHLDRSMLIIDPKGEQAAITANYRRTKGPVIIINPFGVLTKVRPDLQSDGFNPLAIPSFDVKHPDFYSQALAMGEGTVSLADTKEIFFPQYGQGLMSALYMRAKWLERENNAPATMRQVNTMLRADIEKFRTIMEEMVAHHYAPMGQLVSRFTVDSRTIDSVVATVHSQTKFLNDGVILADMDKHPTIGGKPFDFEMLKHRVITVYVILPDNRLSTHSVWLRLIVTSALDALTRSEPGSVRPILLVNEAGNLGKLDPLSRAMGMAAGRGVSLWTVWQSLAQITHLYGAEGREEFLSGAGVFNSFRTNDIETANYLSRRLGNQTVPVRTYNTGDNLKKSGSDTPHGFALRHINDLMALKNGKLLSWIEPAQAVPFELECPGYWDLNLKGLDPNPYFKQVGYGKRAA